MDVTVSLPEDLERFVERKIASGRYDSSSDVIGEALRLMETIEHQSAKALGSLRRAWQEGIDSGDAGELDFAELRTDAQARLAAAKD